MLIKTTDITSDTTIEQLRANLTRKGELLELAIQDFEDDTVWGDKIMDLADRVVVLDAEGNETRTIKEVGDRERQFEEQEAARKVELEEAAQVAAVQAGQTNQPSTVYDSDKAALLDQQANAISTTQPGTKSARNSKVVVNDLSSDAKQPVEKFNEDTTEKPVLPMRL